MPDGYVVRHPDAAAFLDHAGAFLARREAMNNLIIGLANTVARDAPAYPQGAALHTLEVPAGILMAALRTPPHDLVLSTAEPDAAAHLPQLVGAVGRDLPGVLGPRAAAADFCAHWSKATGAAAGLLRRERIYELRKVALPGRPSAGTLRRLTASDRPWVETWLAAFAREAMPDTVDPESAARDAAARRLRAGRETGLFAWVVEGEPRSLAGFTGPTITGIRVGPVYTPPAHRRRGCASALVAALSRWLLDAGYARCFLFTDLANPTSNHVYQNVGYRAVGDVDQYRFS